MRISVLIPNYNGKKILQEHLPLVKKYLKDAEIVIVDDGSTDESCEYLRKNHPEVILIEKATNTGFSQTVNIGMKAAHGEIVVLLNSDVVPLSNFLPKILDHFKNENVFAVGFLDERVDKDGVVSRGRGVGRFTRGFFLHGAGDLTKHDSLWANGGSSAFRKSVWHKLGGLAHIYSPFYWEDIDLSYRALKAGYEIRFDPTIKVRHHHLSGSIKSNFTAEYVHKINYRNQFLFVWLNISDFGYLLEHLLYLPVHLLRGPSALRAGFWSALMLAKKAFHLRSINQHLWKKSDRTVLKSFAYESVS